MCSEKELCCDRKCDESKIERKNTRLIYLTILQYCLLWVLGVLFSVLYSSLEFCLSDKNLALETLTLCSSRNSEDENEFPLPAVIHQNVVVYIFFSQTRVRAEHTHRIHNLKHI